MGELEPRVIDLELRYMKLERELHQLSEVVAAQQRVIDALTLEAKRQRFQRDNGGGDEPAIGHEKPPHY